MTQKECNKTGGGQDTQQLEIRCGLETAPGYLWQAGAQCGQVSVTQPNSYKIFKNPNNKQYFCLA